MNTKTQALQVIKNAKINNKISHAYLFFGEVGVNVFEVALEAIKIIICDDEKCMNAKTKTIEDLNYPDLLLINPEKNLITKESIVNALKNITNTSLVNNKKKILLIKDVDLGNKSSLNSLLKYMEDPSHNTHIIMTTNKIDLLLSTVKSRTQNIMVKRDTTNEVIQELIKHKVSEKYLRLFANIFPNWEKFQELDLEKFKKTYSKILKALEVGVENSEKMKLMLSEIITKETFQYSISILEYFFFQVQSSINEKYPLFPKSDDLINKYKSLGIDYPKIFTQITILKKSITNRGNFNLQKESFLLNLVGIYNEG